MKYYHYVKKIEFIAQAPKKEISIYAEETFVKFDKK